MDTEGVATSAALHRTLTLPQILLYGVGSSVGAGVYSLIGLGAVLAGPAVSLSYLLCGVACVFTSLSYAEFAARFPGSSGSAYTFVSRTFGETCGWCVGWNLTLGYGVSAAVVARSWAEYLRALVRATTGRDWAWSTDLPLGIGDLTCCPASVVVVAACTVILVRGTRDSTTFNSIMTGVNLSVLTMVVLCGLATNTYESYVDNLFSPFAPHGVSGIASAAGLLFFSYLGFDMVATLSEEVKNPQRNMPRGIVGSLCISMVIYVVVSTVVVSMAPVSLLVGGGGDDAGHDTPVSNALVVNACCTHDRQSHVATAASCLDAHACSAPLRPALLYVSYVVSLGALFGLTTAAFTCLMGQPRIFYRMARDGLLPRLFAEIDPVTAVPVRGTVVTGVGVALTACLVPLEPLADMISLGTLMVFTFVNAGVIVLRMGRAEEDADRGGNDVHAMMGSDNESGVAGGSLDQPLLLSTIKEEQQPGGSLSIAAFIRSHCRRGDKTDEDSSAASTSTSRMNNAGSGDADPITISVNHNYSTLTQQQQQQRPPPQSSAHAFTSLSSLDPCLLHSTSSVAGDTTAASVGSDDSHDVRQQHHHHGSKPQALVALFTASVLVVSRIFATTNVATSSSILHLVTLLGVVSGVLCAGTLCLVLPLPKRRRRQHDDDDVPFRCPCVPAVPLLGIGCNAFLMGSMPATAWWSISVWILVGLGVLLLYGRRGYYYCCRPSLWWGRTVVVVGRTDHWYCIGRNGRRRSGHATDTSTNSSAVEEEKDFVGDAGLSFLLPNISSQ